MTRVTTPARSTPFALALALALALACLALQGAAISLHGLAAGKSSPTTVTVDGGSLNGGSLNGGSLNGGSLNGGSLN